MWLIAEISPSKYYLLKFTLKSPLISFMVILNYTQIFLTNVIDIDA